MLRLRLPRQKTEPEAELEAEPATEAAELARQVGVCEQGGPRLTNETIREAVKAFCEEGGGKEKADFLHSPQAEAKYGPVSAWDVSAVTNMYELFRYCEAFNQPLGAWKVDRVTDMGFMFRGAAALTRKPAWYRAR